MNADYLRNQLSSEPTEFDRAYVQTLPRLSLSSVPYTLVQTETPLLRHLAVGLDSSVTRFHQVDQEEDERLRNANRFSVQPYLMWHLFTFGPLSLSTRYTYDQQAYRFEDKDQPHFGKNAGIVKTEMSFTMDKIFGLAFEEKIPIKYIPQKDLKALRRIGRINATSVYIKKEKSPLLGKG